MPEPDHSRNARQLVWGLALMAAGVGVFLALPARMAQIAALRQVEPYSLDMLFIRFCIGLMGILLIGGGGRKVWTWWRSRRS